MQNYTIETGEQKWTVEAESPEAAIKAAWTARPPIGVDLGRIVQVQEGEFDDDDRCYLFETHYAGSLVGLRFVENTPPSPDVDPGATIAGKGRE